MIIKDIILDDIKSDRYTINSYGEVFDKKYNRIIKGHLNKGYLRVTLMQNSNTQRSYYIHILVACMFHGDYREILTVNHDNGVKTCNTSENLVWVTHRDNMKHAIETNLIKGKMSLSDVDVENICHMLSDGYEASVISEATGFSKSAIYGIRNGLNWKDISSKYIFPTREKYVLLTEDIVHLICKDLSIGMSIKDVSIKYNVKYPTVGSINQKITWKHISQLYF